MTAIATIATIATPAAASTDRLVNSRFCELLESAGFDCVSMRNAEGVQIDPRAQMALYGQAWREFAAEAYGPLDID